MLKGIEVKLYKKVEAGRDNLNNPIYEEVLEIVKNVLVSPSSAGDSSAIVSSFDFVSSKKQYILGIPKGDQNDWRNVKVEFFGKTFKTFGTVEEGIESMVPGPWHKKIACVEYE